MNQPTTPNTVEDFLPLPEPKDRGMHEDIAGKVRAALYDPAEVRAAILADRAQRTPAATDLPLPPFYNRIPTDVGVTRYSPKCWDGVAAMMENSKGSYVLLSDVLKASPAIAAEASLPRTPAGPVVAEGLRDALQGCVTLLEKMDTIRHIAPEFEVLDKARDLLAAHPVAGSPADTLHGFKVVVDETMPSGAMEFHSPAEPMPASEAQQQLGRMRQAFHINMLRAYPEKSHAEISAEIDKACGAAPVPASEAANEDIKLSINTLREHAKELADKSQQHALGLARPTELGLLAGRVVRELNELVSILADAMPQDERNDALRAAPAAIVGGPVADADAPFYEFWYSHMVNEQMTGALSYVGHSTARYIWDAATRFRAEGGINNDSTTNLAAPAAPTDAKPEDV